jgi:hypothetical protein
MPTTRQAPRHLLPASSLLDFPGPQRPPIVLETGGAARARTLTVLLAS